MEFHSTILVLAGLGNSGEDHWQSHLERKFPDFHRIRQKEWNLPVCKEWIHTLDLEVMKYSPENVILVAHSLACATICFWAAKYKRKIKGALLVGPSDTEADSYPPGTTGFTPVPLNKLPFRTIVVMSTNDPYVSTARALLFAEKWNSELVNIGKAGHINVASGYGEWEECLSLLKGLDIPKSPAPIRMA
jgi:predicted alpha/beta hydrolase family esterase